MPRNKHRFERLHQSLKESGYTATDGPTGNYLKYLKGENKLTVPRKPAGKYLKVFNVGVIPFSEEPDTDANAINHIQATMTVQADNVKSLFSQLTDDSLGLQRDLNKTRYDLGFYSAKASIRIVQTSLLTGSKDQNTSSITKRPYKSYKTRSGSVPYGRTTTVPAAETEGGKPTTPTISTVAEEDVRKSIVESIKGKVGGSYTCMDVSFIPEEFSRGREVDIDKPKSPPTDIPAN